MSLNQYICGKRVCICGPAGYLEGLGRGPLIDSYDIVVRINESIFRPVILNADYGVKNNIWYLNGMAGEAVRDHPEIIPAVDWLCFKCECHRTPFLEKTAATNTVLIEGTVETDTFMGLTTVRHVLTYEPSEVFVCGFSFYAGKRYHDGYAFQYSASANDISHDVAGYRAAMKNLLTAGKIKMDDEGKAFLVG